MTFKTFAFMTVLVSAVAMGACGKSDSVGPKDSKLAGSCEYSLALDDGSKVSICEQLNLVKETTNSDLDKATEGLKADCQKATDGKFNSSGCTTKDAIGGCRGTDGVSTVVYKSAGISTAKQVRDQCAARGLEFFQP